MVSRNLFASLSLLALISSSHAQDGPANQAMAVDRDGAIYIATIGAPAVEKPGAWRVDLGAGVTSVSVSEGRLYVGGDRFVARLDASTGEVQVSAPIDSAQAIAAASDGVMYVATVGAIRVLDARMQVSGAFPAPEPIVALASLPTGEIAAATATAIYGYSRTGELRRRLDLPPSTSVAALTADIDGSMLLAGSFLSGNTTDVFLAKANSSLTAFEWTTRAGGTGWDAGRALAVAADGTSIIGGYGDSPDFPSPGAGWRYFLLKVQGRGQFQSEPITLRAGTTRTTLTPRATQNPVAAATSLSIVAGDGQNGAIGQAYGARLKVKVLDQVGAAYAGATVVFAIGSGVGGGSFSGSTTVTSAADGTATAPALIANSSLGTFTVTATLSGTPASVTFTLTNTNTITTLSTTSIRAGPSTGSDSVLVGSNGTWTATAGASWLHTSASAFGNSTAAFTYDANTGGTRTGTITIGGQTLTVTQGGSDYVNVTTSTILASGGTNYNYAAAEPSGNSYFSNDSTSISKWTASAGTTTALIASGTIGGLAVDPSGNVYYIAGDTVRKWAAATQTSATLISSGLSSPTGLAADSAGNLYIADAGNSAVKRWTLSTSSLSTLASGESPRRMAVDGVGNVYFSTSNNEIRRWDAFTQETGVLLSGLTSAAGLTVDLSGNLYYADGQVLKVRSGATQAVSQLLSASPSTSVKDVAVDIARSLTYTADTASKAVWRVNAWVPTTTVRVGATSGSSFVQVLPVSQGLNASLVTSKKSWLTVGTLSSGTVGFSFAANSSAVNRSATLTVLGQPVTVLQAGNGVTDTLTIQAGNSQSSFTSTVYTTNLQVLAKDKWATGAAGQSITFTVVAGSNGASASFSGSSTVTTNASGIATAPSLTPNNIAGSFTVTAAWTSAGVSQTFTLSSTALAVLPISSLVVGPSAGSDRIVFYSPTSWSASSNSSWLHMSSSGTGPGIATFTIDANTATASRAGTLTIADQIVTITQAPSNYSNQRGTTTLISSGNNLFNVSIDPAGTVYYSDNSSGQILKWHPSTQTATHAIGANPDSIAAYSEGVYFPSGDIVRRWTSSNNQSATVISSGLNLPLGVAVDFAGNLYVADNHNDAIKKWNATTSQVSTLATDPDPGKVAADGAGNVYYTHAVTETTTAVKKWNVTTQTTSMLFHASPGNLQADYAGNLYYSIGSTVAVWNAATQATSTVVPTVDQGVIRGTAVDSLGNVFYSTAFGGSGLMMRSTFWSVSSIGLSSGAGTGTFSILPATQTLTGVFAPSSDQSWLTITSVSNGVIQYSYTANTESVNRTANLIVLGKSIPVTQAASGATDTLTKLAGNYQAVRAGSTFGTALKVTAKDQFGALRQGSTVTYTVTPGPTGATATFSGVTSVITGSDGGATAPSLVAGTVAGAFTVTAALSGTSATQVFELAVVPVYNLASTNVVEGPSAGSDQILLSTNAAWTAATTDTWIHTSASGSGNGAVTFTFDANMGAGRSGTITVGDRTITVLQAPGGYSQSTGGALLASYTNSTGYVATDGSGIVNFFLSPNSVLQWTPSTQSTATLFNGSQGRGLAADAWGNIYLITGNTIVKYSALTLQTTTLISGVFDRPFGLAADSFGNLYIGDNHEGNLKKWTASTQQLSNLVTGVTGIARVAVDVQGNVYYSGDSAKVFKWSSSTSQSSELFTPSGVNGLEPDYAGNIYYSSGTDFRKWSLSTQQSTNLFSYGESVSDVALDATGNLYGVESGSSLGHLRRRSNVWISPAPALSRFAGSNSLSIFPATQSLTGVFAPASDQSWLTLATAADGIISFSYTENKATEPRTAHINVLGTSITITQKGSAVGSVSLTAGNNQSTVAGQPFATNLKVTVLDLDGNPLTGASVTFTTSSASGGANGSFTAAATVTTGADGTATAPVLTANLNAGTFRVKATASNLGTTADATFNLTNLARVATTMTKTSGDNQSSPIQQAFANALQVTVFDQAGAAMPGVTVTFAAVAGATGASGSFASSSPTTGSNGVAAAGTLTANSVAGTFTVKASTPNGVSQNFSLTNLTGSQTIKFNAISNMTYGAAPFNVSPTASSGLTVTLTSTTTSVCTVSAFTVTVVGAGNCSLTASQDGNANYNPAPAVTRSFTVAKASQTITFNAISNVTYGVAPFNVSPTASSGLTVTLTSTTTSVCTVSAFTVTVVGAGSCSLTASQVGNANYKAATAITRSFTVAKASQTITFAALPDKTFGAAPFTVSATASSGLSVTFLSTTTAVCTVSGSTVTIVGGGVCSITASQAGNGNYNAASASQSFTVAKAVPVVTWASPAAIAYGSALGSSQLNATANVAGMFLYSPAAGTVLQAGTHTLSVTFMPAASNNYEVVTVSRSITVTPVASSGANLVLTNTIANIGGSYVVTLTIANNGGTAAQDVVLSTARIGTTSGTPLPQTLGSIAAGTSIQTTITFPSSAGAPASTSALTLAGTYTGGTFNSGTRITLP